MPRAPSPWLEELARQMPEYGIDTDNEVASFIAQLAHESMEFTRLEESLNYSPARLPQVWPRFALNPDAPPAARMPNHLAFKYARNPVALANCVYANRMGNGDEASGDGWRYHGRGPIQLTGRNNYTACSRDTGLPLLQQPQLLLTARAGIASACWYWMARGLDRHDDDDDIRTETRLVNGGQQGIRDREHYFRTAAAVLQQRANTNAEQPLAT